MIEGLEHLRRVAVGVSRYQGKMLEIAMNVATMEMAKLRMEFIRRTPIDEGDAINSWTPVNRDNTRLSFMLDVPYGQALDIGSTPGAKPWPNPGPKTALYKGRIFSDQVSDGEGGMTAEILTDARKGDIAEKISDALMKELLNALG